MNKRNYQSVLGLGKIIPNRVKLELHEYNTILYFTALGKDVELIPPSHTPYIKTPDFWMDGLQWEMKSPTVNHRRTVERLFYQACSQSANVIFDLRRIKGVDYDVIALLEKSFQHTRRVRRMYIIPKQGNLRFYKKQYCILTAYMLE